MLNDDFNTPLPKRPAGFIAARNLIAALFDKMLKTTVLNGDGTSNIAATRDLHRIATRTLLKLPHLTTMAELEQVHDDALALMQTHQNLAA